MACRLRKPSRKMPIGGIISLAQTGRQYGQGVKSKLEATDGQGNLLNRNKVETGFVAGSQLDPLGTLQSEHLTGREKFLALSAPGIGGAILKGRYADRLEQANRESVIAQRRAQLEGSGVATQSSMPLLPMGGLIPYNNETVELEKGEPFMQPNGQIDKISDNAPTHAQGGVPITLPSGTKVLGKKPATDEKTFKELGSKLERQQKKYQKILDENPSRIEEETVTRMLSKVNREFNNLFELQGEDVGGPQFPMGGLIPYPNGGKVAIDSTLPGQNAAREVAAAYRPAFIEQQSYGDFEAADYGDLLSSVPLYSPVSRDSIVAVENRYKGVPGPQYFPAGFAGQQGSRMEKYQVDDTTRFAGSETPQFGYGGKIRKGQLGLQTDDPYAVGLSTDPSVADAPTTQVANTGGGNFNAGNVFGTIGALAPVAYNLYQGMQKPEQIATNAFRNPYESEVRATLRDRRYNITPELEAARLRGATTARRLREAAPTQAQYIAGLQGAGIAESRATAEALARKQNVENQYLSEQAQMDARLGQADVERQRYIEDINARSRAAQRQFTSTGLTQLGQFAQIKQQENNQMIRDMQRLNLLPSLVQNFELGPDGNWRFKQTGEVVEAVDVERYVKGINQ